MWSRRSRGNGEEGGQFTTHFDKDRPDSLRELSDYTADIPDISRDSFFFFLFSRISWQRASSGDDEVENKKSTKSLKKRRKEKQRS